MPRGFMGQPPPCRVVNFARRFVGPGERAPGTHWIRNGSRAGLDGLERRKVSPDSVLVEIQTWYLPNTGYRHWTDFLHSKNTDLKVKAKLSLYLTSWRWVVSSRPCRFTPGERAPPPPAHWRGGWVDPRAGLDDMKKWIFLTLPRLELQPFDRPACSQSLYRLSYRGS
jgi:hypothetical protein